MKRFTGFLELIQLNTQNPLEKFFKFHHLPKLYIGFDYRNSKIAKIQQKKGR